VGLGVMGLADLFARLNVPYDSEEALGLAAKIAEFLTETSRTASQKLGERRGSFPAFDKSIWPKCGFSALRNATATCVAPTGTISLLAGVSASIEPFFALAFTRHMLDGQRLTIRKHGSLRRTDLPEEIKSRYPIALEIKPEWHVRMQAAFQAHIDAAVSKTVNLPPDAPASAVRDVFVLARSLHLKGVTIYRYGSRAKQTLSLIAEDTRPDCRECAV
jgi:ribonucleoside-diphosphate reductase alpha chain